MKKITTNEIAVFSDIHWGCNKDNVEKLKYTQEFQKFLIKTLYKREIKTVFFLGDFFDNRTSLNVQTLNVAYNNLKKLCEYFSVYLILGNHDLFFKNSRKIQSIKPFTEIENLNIIQDNTVFDFNGKTVMCCPWGVDINELDNYDYMLGHFNMNGAELCKSIYQKGHYSMKELNDIAPLVFSGHFHIRKEYPTKSGKVITTGNPLQTTWGDYNNDKGFYILNTLTSEYEFIHNSRSPVHNKILWSETKEGLQQKHIELIKGNYIKLMVDCEYQYQDVLKLASEIKLYEPLTCNIEYVFSINKHLLGEVKENKKEINLDKMGYIKEFIKKIAKENKQKIDYRNVLKRLKTYHQIAEKK